MSQATLEQVFLNIAAAQEADHTSAVQSAASHDALWRMSVGKRGGFGRGALSALHSMVSTGSGKEDHMPYGVYGQGHGICMHILESFQERHILQTCMHTLGSTWHLRSNRKHERRGRRSTTF